MVVETETGVVAVAVAAVAVLAEVAGAGTVVVVVVAVPVGVGCATRMQHRTPRLRLRAPSTPTCKGAGGSFLLTFSRRRFALSYSSPSCGMNRSKPESGVAESIIF